MSRKFASAEEAARYFIPRAHFVDLHIRCGGKWIVLEGDWIKRLLRKQPSPESPKEGR